MVDGNSKNDVFSPLRLVAIATSLMPEKQFTGYQKIVGSVSGYHDALVTDINDDKYLIRAPEEILTPKFTAEIKITQALHSKIAQDKIPLHFKIPKVLASNQKIAILHPYSGRAITPSALSPEQVHSLAKSLARLHSIPYSIVEQNDLPSFTNRETQKNLINVLDEVALLGKVPAPLLERFESILNEEVVWSYDSTVIHGDICPNNILFAGDDVSYILSWGSLQYGDGAYDLAGIAPALTSANSEILFDVYQKTRRKLEKNTRFDPNLQRRTEFYAQFELIQNLLIAHTNRDTEAVGRITDELLELSEKVRLADALDEMKERTRQREELAQQQAEHRRIQDSLNTQKLLRSDILAIREEAGAASSQPNTQPNTQVGADKKPEKKISVELELEQMLAENTVRVPVGPRATVEAPVIHASSQVIPEAAKRTEVRVSMDSTGEILKDSSNGDDES
jgi:aminoglycoside phosphotransferase (APT) family kinase protein